MRVAWQTNQLRMISCSTLMNLFSGKWNLQRDIDTSQILFIHLFLAPQCSRSQYSILGKHLKKFYTQTSKKNYYRLFISFPYIDRERGRWAGSSQQISQAVLEGVLLCNLKQSGQKLET